MNQTVETIKKVITRKVGHMNKALLTVLFLLGWAIPSQALQLGEWLLVEAFYPTTQVGANNPWFSQTFEISEGVEVNIGNAFILVNINAGTSSPEILFNFNSQTTFRPAEFNGFRFTAISETIGEFTGLTTNEGATTVANFGNTRLSFTPEELYINFQGLTVYPTQSVGLNLAQASAVPEPGTLVLLGAGLLGLGVLRRRKRNDLA